MNTIDLGFKNFNARTEEGLILARVVAEHRELYRVKTANSEYNSKVTGKKMYEARGREDFPAVGDFVAIKVSNDDHAVIKNVLPRKTAIKKRRKNIVQIIAANIDIAFIVESVDRDFNINRLERYCTLCLQEKIQPVVILNKIDLIPDVELKVKLNKIRQRLKDIVIIPTSVSAEEGLEKLESFIQKGTTYCFLGSSGVGKSSIINKLIGVDLLKTREIGEGTGRGKHTTSRREMFFLENGGILIDNPGMREVGLADFESGISQVFDDISTLARECKFADCAHINEPGCAVLLALNSGRLDSKQYDNYVKLKKEADFYQMTDAQRHVKDRRFGKHIKNSLKKLDKY